MARNHRIWVVAFQNPQSKENEFCSVERNIFCSPLVGNTSRNAGKVNQALQNRNRRPSAPRFPPHREVQTKSLLRRPIQRKVFLTSKLESPEIRLQILQETEPGSSSSSSSLSSVLTLGRDKQKLSENQGEGKKKRK